LTENHTDMDLQRHKLDLWLKEWELDRALAADPELTTETQRSVQQNPVKPQLRLRENTVSESIAAGQIRLLHPLPASPASDRPIYVAVLRQNTDGTFLIVPFSRFSTPAVPGELKTGLEGIHVRVLCVWNSRTVQASTLAHSWHAGEISDDKMRQALDLHRRIAAQRGNDGLPGKQNPSLEDEIGPPLLHPLDPRHQYLAEESATFDEALTAAESQSASTRGITYDCSSKELLKAAEGRTEYNAKPKRRRRA
jgi:hypothetical protein